MRSKRRAKRSATHNREPSGFTNISRTSSSTHTWPHSPRTSFANISSVELTTTFIESFNGRNKSQSRISIIWSRSSKGQKKTLWRDKLLLSSSNNNSTAKVLLSHRGSSPRHTSKIHEGKLSTPDRKPRPQELCHRPRCSPLPLILLLNEQRNHSVLCARSPKTHLEGLLPLLVILLTHLWMSTGLGLGTRLSSVTSAGSPDI
jgi:hypothetical protein